MDVVQDSCQRPCYFQGVLCCMPGAAMWACWGRVCEGFSPWPSRALSLDGWRHVAFIDDGLLALTALRGVAALNLQVGF